MKNLRYCFLGFLMTLTCWSVSVSAQTFLCPNGPGPGENQVGMVGGSHGVGATPLCASDGSESKSETEPAPRSESMPSVWVDSHVAVAWHAKSPSIWATWGQRRAAVAKAIVLDACNATMGGGCTMANAAHNSSIAIGRDDQGLLQAWGETVSDAKAGLKKVCGEAKTSCKVEHVFTAEPWREPAYFGRIEQQISDETGVHQQYFFPENSRIKPPEPRL